MVELGEGCPSYPLRERILWIWRNLAGVADGNPAGIEPLEASANLHPIVPRMRLGFLGDIMGLGGRRLHVAQEVKTFLADCQVLVGNLEGLITRTRVRGLCAQAHDPSILQVLAGLFPPAGTVLSLANNHTGDFSVPVLQETLSLLRGEGFRVIGLREAPFIDLDGPVRLVAASAWSNRFCGEVVPLSALWGYADPDRLNIAYPHWGYELERYPRVPVVAMGDGLLSRYGAVMGHHAHTPQPVAARRVGRMARPVAYSLGNFCTGLPLRKFQHGLVCKLEIGPDDTGVWHVGHLQWRCLHLFQDRSGTVTAAWFPLPVGDQGASHR